MIKFFRKIRHKAISETKFGKYFFYAIGEIVLVVIGILIALYLNNKKENADVYKKQQDYLSLIKRETESNLEILRNEREDLGTIIENNRALINLMDSDSAIVSTNENELAELLLMPISRSISIDYENGAFNEFISSGGLKDLKNDSIRGVLRSWESKITTLKDQELAVHKSLNKMINYVEEFGSLRVLFDEISFSEDLGIRNSQRKLTNKSLLKSKQLENILLNYIAVSIQLHDKNYPRFEEDMNTLIRLIENELKN